MGRLIPRGVFRRLIRPNSDIPTREYALPRGLSRGRAEAMALRLDKRMGFGDRRGFTYDPRTGRATLT